MPEISPSNRKKVDKLCQYKPVATFTIYAHYFGDVRKFRLEIFNRTHIKDRTLLFYSPDALKSLSRLHFRENGLIAPQKNNVVFKEFQTVFFCIEH
jgi:hypothetical protein